MKVTENELIERLKELIIYDVHMSRAADGAYEEEKYYEMVNRQGKTADYYQGHNDAIHTVLLMIMGGKKLMEFDMEMIESLKKLDEAKDDMS